MASGDSKDIEFIRLQSDVKAMGWARVKQVSRYRIPVAALLVVAVIVIGLAWMLRPNEVVLFSFTENEVNPYPHYFRTPFSVHEHENLDAYLLVRMEIQGFDELDNLWLIYSIFIGNLTAFDMIHDPTNYGWSSNYSLRFESGTIRTGFQELSNLTLTPGDYIWAHYFTTTSEGIATSLSVTVSVIYK